MMVARKSMAEIRAEERMAGFYACMRILEREWRSQVRLAPGGPVGGEQLWPILEKMQAHGGLYDDDYKVLSIPRMYGSEYERLRVRVEVLAPHPHAGRKGFILDSEAFMKDGMFRVFFLDGTDRGADNAYARPEQIKRIK
jgi:hypothetical protein